MNGTTGDIISGEVPYRKERVNKPKAKEVMQAWNHVVLHIKALCALRGGNLETEQWWGVFDNMVSTDVPSVEDTDAWIANHMRNSATYIHAIRDLREWLYRKHDVYYFDEAPLRGNDHANHRG
jgi:hypothetical protein